MFPIDRNQEVAVAQVVLVVFVENLEAEYQGVETRRQKVPFLVAARVTSRLCDVSGEAIRQRESLFLSTLLLLSFNRIATLLSSSMYCVCHALIVHSVLGWVSVPLFSFERLETTDFRHLQDPSIHSSLI